ncbi:MAG: 4-hydroxybenzoate octaprenyltransferase [Hydrogenophilus sp.]|nr:4-hydroxybenzoate octaprenyltransferase [Hydrogenophilus sp.]
MREWQRRADPYWRLIRGDRPVGTVLLLWPTWVALFFAARGQPPAELLAIFAAGTFLMRSAGCAVNDWADRKIDPFVRRTATRPLARGEIPAAHALWVAIGLAAMAAGLAALLGTAVVAWAVPAAVVAAIYPFTKRFFAVPQLVLGVAFSFGIPMAFVAVGGEVRPEAFWLFVGNLLWVVAYDTAYAMADRADDLRLGVKSSAIWFGRFEVMAIAACELLALAAWAVAGRMAGAGVAYWVGLIAIALLWAAQLAPLATREESKAFAVFGQQQWVGLLWFLGTVFAFGSA